MSDLPNGIAVDLLSNETDWAGLCRLYLTDDRQRLNTSLRKYVARIDMMMVIRVQYGLAEMNALRFSDASKVYL